MFLYAVTAMATGSGEELNLVSSIPVIYDSRRIWCIFEIVPQFFSLEKWMPLYVNDITLFYCERTINSFNMEVKTVLF